MHADDAGRRRRSRRSRRRRRMRGQDRLEFAQDVLRFLRVKGGGEREEGREREKERERVRKSRERKLGREGGRKTLMSLALA